MAVWLTNAFSLNMLSMQHSRFHLVVDRIDAGEVRGILHKGLWRSAIGHADTARILTGVLGLPIEADRVTLTLDSGDLVLVAQYVGPRLPEGATSLPEGARIDWFCILI